MDTKGNEMTDNPTNPTNPTQPEQPAPTLPPRGMDAQVALDFVAAVHWGARKAALLGANIRAGNLHELIADCLLFCEPSVHAYMTNELRRIEEGYYGRPALCNPRILLPTLLILALVVLALTGGIPLTDHAKNAHAGQLWNAEKIYEYMLSGSCVPQQYACPDQDIEVYCYELHPGKSIGLVIGMKVQQIITGLMARTSWWLDRCE